MFRRWRTANPGGSFAQFYADDARRRSRAGGTLRPKTLGPDLNAGQQRARAESLVGYLKWAGCRPKSLVVDFGCGSLWIGEVLMRFLQPGRYVAMDVVDHFYQDALQRLGRDLIALHQPKFELISPESLVRVQSLRPDFVLSTGVLQHVRPQELGGYFAQIVALCTPATRVFIGHKTGPWRRIHGTRSLQYSGADISRALAGLGYEARFERPPGAPGCHIALFEITPLTSAQGSPD
ncbi:MAG: class I SAM-dependent methyltransferase [Dongiaceae bacterium]